MTGGSVTAGWAVWSKEPGTRDDYSILAFSDGPLSKGEFAQLLAYFAPGSPSAEPDTPASLPWITLSRVGVAQELYLGISLQTATSDKDGAGRPISRTVYFCVPYAPLAGNPVSYQDLYAAVADPGLLASAGRNVIPLALRPFDPAELARAIRNDFGDPELVTRTAAMLLGGPVTITGPKFPHLTERLRFFDTVTALLPYGYRAHLTAATWSDTGAGDRFRLVFADRARDEASRVSWGTLPQPPTACRHLSRVPGPSPASGGRTARVADRLPRQRRRPVQVRGAGPRRRSRPRLLPAGGGGREAGLRHGPAGRRPQAVRGRTGGRAPRAPPHPVPAAAYPRR